MPYEVFLYNVPKVSEDGEKAIPVPPSETREFEDEEGATKFADERKDDFDRVVVIRREDEKQEKVRRYFDGELEAQSEAVSA